METMGTVNLLRFTRGLDLVGLGVARRRSRWVEWGPDSGVRKRFGLLQAVCYGLLVCMLIGSWPQPVLAQLSCSVTQLTDNTPAFGIVTSRISADGTRIVFSSFANLTGGNPDGSTEVFLFDTPTSTLTQITSTPFPVSSGTTSRSINADGTRIAFASTGNLTGGNPDGNVELFLFDTTTNTFMQITKTVQGGSGIPFPAHTINADGTRIAFGSSADLTGGNPDGNREVFLFDTPTNSFTQISQTAVGTPFAGVSADPSINADGTRIVFRGAGSSSGGPGGGPEIFLASCGGANQPPDTSLASAVDGNGMTVPEVGSTVATSITFTFDGSDDVGVAGFECRLDAAAFAPCASPVSYAGLAVGNHTFQVRAIDGAGAIDDTPATFTWTILTPAEGIAELMDTVAALPVSSGIATSLQAPLNNALKKLTDGQPKNDGEACVSLDDFIAHVEELRTANKLTPADAATLTQVAVAIKAAQGCP
jgi:Tol biopolymer transport system component